MKEIISLIKKDFDVDSRQKYPIAGIVLYIFATIYISYLTFQSTINISTWNALFWIILLFASVTGIAKSFIQEENRSLYYFFLSKPANFLAAKLIYSLVYELILISITFSLFSLLLPVDADFNYLFYLNLLNGAIGITASFTLVSALASKTSNQSNLMAVLGFPVIIPILILASTNSRKILFGAIWQDISGNSITLLSLNVIIIAVSFILFPYSWKN